MLSSIAWLATSRMSRRGARTQWVCMNVTFCAAFIHTGWLLWHLQPGSSTLHAAAPWCETRRIAFVKVYSLQFSLISPGIGVLNYMLQRTPHSYFYKTQVIRQTGSAHVPRYDSFRSQGFRPLFPSKCRLRSPSHPQRHAHSPTSTSASPIPLTRREPLSLWRV